MTRRACNFVIYFGEIIVWQVVSMSSYVCVTWSLCFHPGLPLTQPNPNLLKSEHFPLVSACMCLLSSASVDFLDRSVCMSVSLSLFLSLSPFPHLLCLLY